ncbi:MAG: hypothetical protein HY860_06355 [Chlamydiales bacterium]|nr:hypothetical protein [Chlamydiales bacterium]
MDRAHRADPYSRSYDHSTDMGNTSSLDPSTRDPSPFATWSSMPSVPPPYGQSSFSSIDTDRARDLTQRTPSYPDAHNPRSGGFPDPTFTHLTASASPYLEGDEPDNSDDCCLCWLAKKVWDAVVVIFSALFCCSCCYDNKPEEALYARLDATLIPMRSIQSLEENAASKTALAEIANDLGSLDLTTLSQDLDRRSYYEYKIGLILPELIDDSRYNIACCALTILPPLKDPLGKAIQCLASRGETSPSVYVLDKLRTVHPYFLQLETLLTALVIVLSSMEADESDNYDNYCRTTAGVKRELEEAGYELDINPSNTTTPVRFYRPISPPPNASRFLSERK